MSLFNRLLELHSTAHRPVEDFFTEVLAGIFEAVPGLCGAWLEHLDLLDLPSDNTVESSFQRHKERISTQQRLNPLSEHVTGSRPDLMVELDSVSGGGGHVFFVESKIGSKEGEGQLRRYADLLSEFDTSKSRTLIYVTRDYDPKEKSKIIGNTNVKFVQSRWSDLYGFLKSTARQAGAESATGWALDTNSVTLIEEIMHFMEEHGMAQNNLFTTQDLMAITRIQPAISMMEEILRGEVEQELAEFTGSRVGPQRDSLRDLGHGLGRYVLHSSIQPQHKWWCGAGFFTHTDDTYEWYPSATVFLEVGPHYEERQSVLAAMRQWVKRESWYGSALEQEHGEWSTVIFERGLEEFLSEEDHVAAIRSALIGALRELSEMKQEFPELSWNVG